MGNICRSPTAEAVLRRRFADAGLGAEVEVDSAGTGGWHVGADADARSRAVFEARGYSLTHGARKFDRSWFEHLDLVLAMDADNLADLRRLAPDDDARSAVRLFRSFDPAAVAAGELDVPDPYYGGATGFTDVLDLIEAAADGVVAFVAAELGRPAR
jgi:protein-tyrosine phosphatase